MAELTGVDRYQYWLKKAQERGEVFTTRTKAIAKDFFLIHDRRENEGLELPPDVVEGRRWNDSLHKMEKDIEYIKKNTEDVPWLSKFVANIFKSGAGEAEKKYPSRKK